MRTEDFDYTLPPELIAQHPARARDASRLMVLHRSSKKIEHRNFLDFSSFIRPHDLLVLNNSRVLPARLRAFKPTTGGALEVLLIEETGLNEWWVMLRPGKRVRRGSIIQISAKTGDPSDLLAEILEKSEEGHYKLQFRSTLDIKSRLEELGEIPLPPYIERPQGPESQDSERYQTVFAKPPGSVAAPTAGLHFTPLYLDLLRANGVETTEVTLHVGLGTFAPVKVENLAEHKMHEERFIVPPAAADAIAAAKARGSRVIAVGTTSLRVLESAADVNGKIEPCTGKTRLFVSPPYNFRVVDALLTNFHLPKSTLLMLVSAFASPGNTDGVPFIQLAYREAVRERYRFFSYGDAMLIL